MLQSLTISIGMDPEQKEGIAEILDEFYSLLRASFPGRS